MKIEIKQFGAIIENDIDAWPAVEAYLTIQFTDSNGILDQTGYDAALAQVQADEALRASTESASTGAKQWYLDNNASLLFELTIPELQVEIETLIGQILPLATAGQRAKLVLLLMTLSVSTRVLAKREGFVD